MTGAARSRRRPGAAVAAGTGFLGPLKTALAPVAAAVSLAAVRRV